ncbi:protein Flattop isoform X3 [Epinephelus fuscoguttatus]|uniref:protein Flattop isoform X3 n=1 Tax=Epinephelus fuscoguttatus TaxID=293821 RepID=UPI0020D1949A|nr:protein Flattop isoform X3 [Epinephelus fuscoguttatus]
MCSYSANQYDSAFKPRRLQNWCKTKNFKERPTAHEGHTTFIADDRGHLLPGVRGSAWPDFKGTWDLPARIPAHRINPTSRSVEGLNRLRSWGFDPQHTGKSQPHSGSTDTDRPEDVGEQQDGAALSVEVASQEAPSSSKQRDKEEWQDQ